MTNLEESAIDGETVGAPSTSPPDKKKFPRRFSPATIALAVILPACVAALLVGIIPGVLHDLLFMAFVAGFVMAPLVGIAGLFVLVGLIRKGKIRRAHLSAALVLILLFGTYVSLRFYVPRRIAFAASRSAFEQLLPKTASSGVVSLHRRVGYFPVESFASDPRGGVYFRVYSGMDGFGPDVMSYGIVYKPNPSGSPYGNAEYRVFPLDKDWFWFRVSDDF